MKRRMTKVLPMLIALCILLVPVTVFAADESVQKANADLFRAWTLIPPLLAIILAFVTKNVVLSLFLGAMSGCFMLSVVDTSFIGAISGSFMSFTTRAVSSLADSWNAGIVLQVLAIGGLIGLVGKMGGAKAVAESLAKKAKSPTSTGLITWVLGLFVFFDDYANSLIVGPIMRPVTDKMKMSREKLAFIVDATAAPIAGLAIISTWVGYEMSLIKDAYISVGVMDVKPFEIFFNTLPFRFYNILMLFFVVYGCFSLRDFGPMLKAERRARAGRVTAENSTVKVDAEDEFEPEAGVKLSIWNAIVPIGALILFSITGFYFNGLSATETVPVIGEVGIVRYIAEIFGNADASVVIFQAALFAGIIALAMGALQKIFSLKDGIDIWIGGMKSFLITGVILILAWSLSSVIKDLGTRFWIMEQVKEGVPAWLIPTLIFIIGSIISFATGTSYGTMGILMPLAVPLAAGASNGNAMLMLLSTSAVLTGAILGDHCSPISDTTILSSMGASCDHVDHVKTQLPYAIFIGIITIVCGYMPIGVLSANIGSVDGLMWAGVGCSFVAAIVIMVIMRFIGKPVEEKSKAKA